MSNPDSFIDEVTEEVRRDRLYAGLRRYGWIGVLAVIAIVGGTAWQQVSNARAAAAAEARGDALLAALETEGAEARAAALAEVPAEGRAGAVTRLLTAAAEAEAGDAAAAVAALEALAADPAADPVYRGLAELKALMLDEARPAAERAAALADLARPGAPFRMVALEAQALAEIEAGDTEAALATLSAIVGDAEVTAGLRDRAGDLIVALGGDPETGAAPAE